MRHERQRIPDDQWRADGLQKHNLPRPDGLIECSTVLDIGAGIRPMQWYKPDHHICVEPYKPYCDLLEKAGYVVFNATAEIALKELEAPAIYLLDVIEHLEKDLALEVIELAKQKAYRQLVIYTPMGFMEQDEDGWDLGGDEWQTHRSGWLPNEFPDWNTYRYARGFFAIWTHTHN